MRILFDSKLSQFKTPFGTLIPGERCRLRVDIPVSCQAVKAEARMMRDDGVTQAFCVPLQRAEENELYEAWSGEFSFEAAGLYFYYFFITTKNETFRLFKQGNDGFKLPPAHHVAGNQNDFPAVFPAKFMNIHSVAPCQALMKQMGDEALNMQ